MIVTADTCWALPLFQAPEKSPYMARSDHPCSPHCGTVGTERAVIISVLQGLRDSEKLSTSPKVTQQIEVEVGVELWLSDSPFWAFNHDVILPSLIFPPIQSSNVCHTHVPFL